MVDITQHYGALYQNTHHTEQWNTKAKEQWELIFALEHPSEQYATYWEAQARNELTFAYFRTVQHSAAGSDEANEAAAKLLAMVTKDGEVKLSEPLAVCEALARYYGFIGEKEKAMDALKVTVKLNLGMLDDDDPNNDWYAYAGLADDLMFSGHHEHARAAWSMITPTPPVEKTEDKDLDEVSDDGSEADSEDISSKSKDKAASESDVPITTADNVDTTSAKSESTPETATGEVAQTSGNGDGVDADKAEIATASKQFQLEGPL